MSRHRQPYPPPERNQDVLSSSDEYEQRQRQRDTHQPRSNGSRPPHNNPHENSSPSSATSVSDQGMSSPLSYSGNIDPLVNQAIVTYMVNTRKRHLKIQKDYEEKQIKSARTRHNLFFTNHPEYKIQLYDLSSKNENGKNNFTQYPTQNYTRVRPGFQHYNPNNNRNNNDFGHLKQEKPTFNYQPEPAPSYSIEPVVSVPKLDIPSSAPEALDPKVKDVWADVCASISIGHRQASISNLSKTNMYKNLAILCQREVKKATYRRLKPTRDVPSKARRATREMLTFWRRNEKDERETRKRAEREVLEKARLEEEKREAKRQERKLNFLITQTELYGHFVNKRLNDKGQDGIEEGELAPVDFKNVDFDGDESELNEQARISAQQALKVQSERTKEFDTEAKKRNLEGKQALGIDEDDEDQMNFQDPSTMQKDSNVLQPKMLTCELKSYQLKGLNWLSNLYEQGINGILADEMGLGKTVQSISLLAHLAETYNIWGPFLVIAPASTLHNWQQELTKFAPSLKTLPYWGNVKDRKTLRKFWSQKQLYTKDAPFHVLITSYQLILTDEKYFQRIKWQYMILDEAQAIKSSASARWKVLLNFHCRNRLLLTGTPIQNSMQELWALLHFIMPSLFDSHEEFSEWFSKDIENHAEKNGALDQHQLRRLHLILKPFMLRRVKKNVQHELGEKIELEVKCHLTPRQRQLYASLREKISLSELLEKSKSSLDNDNNMESLMNLVIQFRKVCNHPELFERAEVKSPLAFCNNPIPPSNNDFPSIPYNPVSNVNLNIPRLISDEGGILNLPGDYTNYGLINKLIKNTFNIWKADNIKESYSDGSSGFSFLSLSNLSYTELERIQNLDIPTLYELSKVNQKLSQYQYDRKALDIEENNIDLLTPNSLLNDIKTFKEYSDIKEDYFLDMQSLKLTNCAKPAVIAPPPVFNSSSRDQVVKQKELSLKSSSRNALLGLPFYSIESNKSLTLPSSFPTNNLSGFSDISIPDPAKLIMNSGKLMALDKLLSKLKLEGHRVLLYFQMTRMIDLMEEFLTYRQHSYLRLDGSSKISDRRDLVADWQTRPELFIFLLSTRAGGLGINLTAADTVIFYDSDWNPTVDQQAMDRAHRLGQTKQVTVYRLITQNTIEERILQRAKQKDAIHRVVIAGGDYKQDLKPKEIYSLLLDEDNNNNNENNENTPSSISKTPLIEVIEQSNTNKNNDNDEINENENNDEDVILDEETLKRKIEEELEEELEEEDSNIIKSPVKQIKMDEE